MELNHLNNYILLVTMLLKTQFDWLQGVSK